MRQFIRTISVILVSVLTLGQTTGLMKHEELSAKAAPEKSSGQVVVFSILAGDEGIHFKGGDSKETEPWGPASLRIAQDGTFMIADTAANKILLFKPDGSKTGTINIDDAVAVTDVALSGSDFYALDEGAAAPTVYRLSSDGYVLEKMKLPKKLRNEGVSGIAAADSGEMVVEIRGGDATASLSGEVKKGKLIKGERYTARAPDLGAKTADRSAGIISKGTKSIPIKVKNILGAMTVIGTGQDGDFYLLVEELSKTHTLFVDQTIRHYSADGKFLGVARVPLAERYTYVRNGVAVAPDGNVYALITKRDRADVIRLQFRQSLNLILPDADTSADSVVKPKAMSDGATTPQATQQAATCRTRDDMINTAWSYVNNQTYLTTTNLNGACSGRYKPRYLGTSPGYYSSVPYDWGGYDTVSNFNYLMSQGYKAGDIDDYAAEGCSRGVDCSGFVSRCWASGRYTTSSLPSISTRIDVSQAQKGDIINRAGVHVAMFVSTVSNGVMTLEATAYNSYDRVVYLYNGWGRFNGYTFYRYNNACGGSTGAARPVVTSSLRLSSGSPYYVGQTLYAYFTITNRGSQAMTFSRLLAGGRLNADQSCSGGCPDFSVIYNITLSPGQSYSYGGSQYLNRAGNYSFFVAYQRTDGSWVTNVETEGGASNSLSITVQDNTQPSLNRQSPSYIYASAYDQTIYFYGSALTGTDYMYVQFPSGGAGYIYPPAQIFSRSYSQLGCKITFGARGQYYIWAHTPGGGWSNAYPIWVY